MIMVNFQPELSANPNWGAILALIRHFLKSKLSFYG